MEEVAGDRFRQCATHGIKNHIEKVIFTHGKLEIAGFIPMKDGEITMMLPFRIEGDIDKKIRIYAHFAERTQKGRFKALEGNRMPIAE
jgi:hypothetical protein